MKVLTSPVFIICALLFIIHQVLQKGLDITFPMVDRYLDNLLTMPIILSLLLVERQYLFKRGKAYRLLALDVVVATVFITLVSEILFPLFSDDFTTDWWDVAFLALGSLIFYITINTIPTKEKDRDTRSR
ncbi:hypothetical protein [Tunicatimonas pelagia]|uniref:hypothetical protein n=1 Tax=Tunicatimonas pelagia TaxID=931531 RepID=UPI002664EB89|nr:hypothetical protein [Tunicatimonas pelagia]WKN40533.1 hypothetical protein P0M28_15950 [Tunicatimonas pelagia]